MDIWHNMCSDEDSELDYMSWYDDSPSDYDYLYDEDDELYDLDYDDLDSFEEELEDIYEPPSSDEDEDLLEVIPMRNKTKCKPEIADIDIKEVIQEAMAENGVKEDDIPDEWGGSFSEYNLYWAHYADSKRYVEVKGFAQFHCPNKHHRWPSPHSWCLIDLKNQLICHRDGQNCRKCGTEVMPEFPKESLEAMAKQAARRHLERTGKLQPAQKTPEEIQSGPHDARRCGKCRREGSICWK